jgi:hypothetical protein
MLFILTAPPEVPDLPYLNAQPKRDWEKRVKPKTKPKRRKPKKHRYERRP